MTSAKGNAVLVDALASSLMRGGNALEAVPGLLKRVLQEESWREFITQRGELVQHDRFIDFVTAKPLRGIGASVDLLRRMVADDAEASDLLDRALQNSPGNPGTLHNIQGLAPTGTSKAAALRRLRKGAPDLHAEVIAGNLSAHGAMVKAGYRPRTATVRTDSPERVAEALRRILSPEDIALVIKLLIGIDT